MAELQKNQILVTISEDKKTLTIECGAFHRPIEFSNCPKKTIENIGNVINSYNKKMGLSRFIEEWVPEGCYYEGTGSCNDCN